MYDSYSYFNNKAAFSTSNLLYAGIKDSQTFKDFWCIGSIFHEIIFCCPDNGSKRTVEIDELGLLALAENFM